jgi:hypothetical protein
MRQTTALLLILWLLGTGQAEPRAQEKQNAPPVQMPVVVGETTPPVVAISFVEESIYGGPFRPILLVWKEGRIVWSPDLLKGGPPYREGKVAPERVKKVLSDLDRRGVFKYSGRREHYGPDYPYTTIAIAVGTKRLSVSSWHEYAEKGSTVVATAGGLALLEGRDRARVLASEPESYRQFRKVWADLRAGLATLIPDRGREAGKLQFRLQPHYGAPRR